MGLSKEQIARYSRQLILPEVGVSGQRRLLDASVLLVGAGGLGCPAALYLAAAGVGTLGIVDPEVVEPSNLHRQIIHSTDTLGKPKTDSAQARLAALNPDVRVVPMATRLDAGNVLRLLEPYELILDGSDNFPTRYLVNDACVLSNKPLIHGGVVHFGGHVMTIVPRQGACYRCVFPEPPPRDGVPNCQEAVVVGAVAGVIGCVMAQEALKVLLGIGKPLIDRLVVFDGTTSRFREVPVRRAVDCAVCGEHPAIREPKAHDERSCSFRSEHPGVNQQEDEAWHRSR